MTATPFLAPISLEFATNGGGAEVGSGKEVNALPGGGGRPSKVTKAILLLKRSVIRVLQTHTHRAHIPCEETLIYGSLSALHLRSRLFLKIIVRHETKKYEIPDRYKAYAIGG